MTEDSELLRRYAETRSEAAFAELVNRRIALVYSVAIRQVGGDAHLAQDVTQRVFADLACKASALARRPVLTGWLYRSTHFAASDLVRSERRRRAREEEHFQMNQMLAGAEGGQADWSRLRPVIDDVMAELDDEDRDAVALRFLEDKSFAEIGRALQLSEDTARKRVERALDRLHAALAKRGVSSTTQALALVLANQAAASVPAGLAAIVTSGALAGAGAAAAIGVSVLHAVSITKVALAVVGAGAVAATGLAVIEIQAVRDARHELSIASNERDALHGRVRELQARFEAEANRARAVEDDNAKLASAVKDAERAQAAAAAAPITRELVDARYKRAQELARAGNWEAALPELLWCFDEGMPSIGTTGGVRTSFLLSEIGKMAKNFPPAAAALQERRDCALARLQTDVSDRRAALDFASLNRELNDDARTLQLFDSLTKGDPRRATLAIGNVQDLLIEAKRYGDVLDVNPYERMVSFFNNLTRPLKLSNETAALAHRYGVAASGAKNVEVLAGAGELARAREFAQRVLAYDRSPATQRVLQKHLARAGHPDLLKQ